MLKIDYFESIERFCVLWIDPDGLFKILAGFKQRDKAEEYLRKEKSLTGKRRTA